MKFVAQLTDAWAEDGVLVDVELYFKRVNDTTVQYVLSPAAGLLVRRSRTLEPFRSGLAELPDKPDLTGFKRVELS